MPQIDGACRRVAKATYVPLKLDTPLPPTGSAILKFGFIRQLRLQTGEVDGVRKGLGAAANLPAHMGANASIWKTLRAFEGSPLASQLPAASVFAGLPAASLAAFGHALIAERQQAIDAAGKRPAAPVDPAADALTRGGLLHELNGAIVATTGFESNVAATPIGMLNLERLEMTPAGIEHGELLATIPLAPNERTAVVQHEWSSTSQQFTSIVTDSLENYSETGVTENTELAQATTSQTAHSNQFNVNASAQGSTGFVTASVAASFGSQDQGSTSATASSKHAIATTRQASVRVKQSHKVSISTSTASGTSETSTRILENRSQTDPIRIDYFSLLRKWHVGLYRYGLRLTYDIAVPEPGAAMREAFAQLAYLSSQLKPFSFQETHSSINPQTYSTLADKYGASVAPAPEATSTITVAASVPGLGLGLHDFSLPFSVPQGSWITGVWLDASVTGPAGKNFEINILGTTFDPTNQPDTTYPTTLLASKKDGTNYLEHATGSQTVIFRFNDANTADVQLTVATELTPQAFEQWQSDVWNALYNAAQTSFYAEQQWISGQIAALESQINGVDTLTLRREENDEIMKCVLHWLLGPSFDFMPPEVVALFGQAGGADLTHGIAFTGNELGLPDPTTWTTMFQYQEMVKFINEAIEWENVVYFPYSYFWDVPPSWDFIRSIRHPDPTRQAFLRSGSARVVLTVRKGYEEAWVSFVEQGDFTQLLVPGHPYMTIAQSIAAYDSTNYPGIPPANPEGAPLPDDNQQAATSATQAVPASGNPVPIEVASIAGFVVGYSVVVDSWDSGVQETQRITALGDKPATVTVQRLSHGHGAGGPFTVIQPGEKGQLIAEWFEYTPSSGTDIAVTSSLATIA